jgi:hypothetical protein
MQAGVANQPAAEETLRRESMRLRSTEASKQKSKVTSPASEEIRAKLQARVPMRSPSIDAPSPDSVGSEKHEQSVMMQSSLMDEDAQKVAAPHGAGSHVRMKMLSPANLPQTQMANMSLP